MRESREPTEEVLGPHMQGEAPREGPSLVQVLSMTPQVRGVVRRQRAPFSRHALKTPDPQAAS